MEEETVKKTLSKDSIVALILLVVLIIVILIFGLYQLNKIYNSNNGSKSSGKKSNYALNIQEIISEYTNSITALEENTEENRKQKQKLLVHRAKKYLKLRIKWEENTASLKRLRAKNNISEERLMSHLNDFEMFSAEETDIEKEKVSLYGEEYKFKIRSGVDEWKQASILEYANYCNAIENHIQSKDGAKTTDETVNEKANTESSISSKADNHNDKDDESLGPTKIPVNNNKPKNKGTYVVDIDQATADKNAMELIKEMEREEKKNKNKQQKNPKK